MRHSAAAGICHLSGPPPRRSSHFPYFALLPKSSGPGWTHSHRLPAPCAPVRTASTHSACPGLVPKRPIAAGGKCEARRPDSSRSHRTCRMSPQNCHTALLPWKRRFPVLRGDRFILLYSPRISNRLRAFAPIRSPRHPPHWHHRSVESLSVPPRPAPGFRPRTLLFPLTPPPFVCCGVTE